MLFTDQSPKPVIGAKDELIKNEINAYRQVLCIGYAESLVEEFRNSKEKRRDALNNVWDSFIKTTFIPPHEKLIKNGGIEGLVYQAATIDRALSGYGLQKCDYYTLPEVKFCGLNLTLLLEVGRGVIKTANSILIKIAHYLPEHEVNPNANYIIRLLNKATFQNKDDLLKEREILALAMRLEEKRSKKILQALNKVEESLEELNFNGHLTQDSYEMFKNRIHINREVSAAIIDISKNMFSDQMLPLFMKSADRIRNALDQMCGLKDIFEALHYDISAHCMDGDYLLAEVEKKLSTALPSLNYLFQHVDFDSLVKSLTELYKSKPLGVISDNEINEQKLKVVNLITDKLGEFPISVLEEAAFQDSVISECFYEYGLLEARQANFDSVQEKTKIKTKSQGRFSAESENIEQYQKLAQLFNEVDPDRQLRLLRLSVTSTQDNNFSECQEILTYLKRELALFPEAKVRVSILKALGQSEVFPSMDVLSEVFSALNVFLGQNVIDSSIKQSVIQKFVYLSLARNINDLRKINGLRLEPLWRGEDLYSIRVNDKWRFVFKAGEGKTISDINFTDYH